MITLLTSGLWVACSQAWFSRRNHFSKVKIIMINLLRLLRCLALMICFHMLRNIT